MNCIVRALALGPLLISCSRNEPESAHKIPGDEVAKPSFATQARPVTSPAAEATAGPSAAATTSEGSRTSLDSPPGKRADYALYLLALSWAPNFCCSNEHKSKEQCKTLDGSFAANHLTIHGLWPNYNDKQTAEHHQDGDRLNWPQFCAPYDTCEKQGPVTCYPKTESIPADMNTYGPGFVTDHYFLANHEWPKHGSCTGLGSRTYFSESIKALLALPGDKGTPKVLADNIGKKVTANDLRVALEHPESVVLSCDKDCNLSQVGICLESDAGGRPAGRVACPKNVTTGEYDNGCFINNRCPAITIQDMNHCPMNECGNPGQGPACTSDEACTSQGFKRCAKSGCCTNVPK